MMQESVSGIMWVLAWTEETLDDPLKLRNLPYALHWQ